MAKEVRQPNGSSPQQSNLQLIEPPHGVGRPVHPTARPPQGHGCNFMMTMSKKKIVQMN